MLLIDGHNLIGRTPGLSLADEERSRESLLRKVAAVGSARGDSVVVVFDGDRPGSSKETRFGGVRVVFAPRGRSADDEILRRLRSGNPRGVTVITADRALAGLARDLGARVESSDGFFARSSRRRRRGAGAVAEPEPRPEEVDEWLELFASARGRRDGHKM